MIRFGLIGTNWITDRLLESALRIDDFQLTAVYSRTKARGREFANKYGAEKVYTNVEEMAQNDEIDAVYIASPNSLHLEQSLTFLKSGKHVLCEKPLASNPREVEMMIKAAKENNVVLMEAMKTTLLPNFTALKDNLQKIGKVRRYHASYCKYSSRYDAYREGTILNAFNPKFSNGSLMDLGVYCIFPLVVLFGAPKNIKANAIMLDSGVDGGGSLLLEYDGFEAVITHSKIVDSYIPSEIQGEEGSFLITELSDVEQIELRYRNGNVEKIGAETIHPSMYYEIEEFIHLIKTGKIESKVNSHENSLIVANIVEEARKQFGLKYPADLN